MYFFDYCELGSNLLNMYLGTFFLIFLDSYIFLDFSNVYMRAGVMYWADYLLSQLNLSAETKTLTAASLSVFEGARSSVQQSTQKSTKREIFLKIREIIIIASFESVSAN